MRAEVGIECVRAEAEAEAEAVVVVVNTGRTYMAGHRPHSARDNTARAEEEPRCTEERHGAERNAGGRAEMGTRGVAGRGGLGSLAAADRDRKAEMPPEGKLADLRVGKRHAKQRGRAEMRHGDSQADSIGGRLGIGRPFSRQGTQELSASTPGHAALFPALQ